MSYEVIVPEKIKRKIAGWNLSSYLLFRIEDRLIYGDIAEHPNRHLQRLPKPADILQYSFLVTDQGTPARTYLFVFDVAYTVDERCLVIRDCDYLTD